MQADHAHLQSELAYFKGQLEELQRLIFGKRSERFVPQDTDQLGLFGQPTEKVEEEPVEQITYQRKKTKEQPVRKALPAHLPRIEEVIEPQGLPEGAKKIGEAVTEVLEYTPGKVFVRKIVRPKYTTAEQEGVLIAALPSLPLPKSNAGAGLLAYLMVSKWVDHLPYYRQVQIFKREGVELSETTVNNWFTNTAQLLTPLYEALITKIREATYLQADESPLKVQDKNKKGTTHRGYHWVYHDPLSKLVVYDYRASRSAKGPLDFLEHFKGTLQTDGYTAYQEIAHTNGLTMLACIAHARRYFEQALDHDKARATTALTYIQQLYAIERECKEQELSYQQIYERRQQKALPILTEWKQWLTADAQLCLPPKGKISKAINYTLRVWDRLVNYTSEGSYHIDNNLIENTIRPLAIGRKNYLFAGSHQAAGHAAMFYSFFATCKLHQVNPLEWLSFVLHNIQEQPINKIDQLLPHNYHP